METLPNWFWVTFYIFLLVTLVMAIFTAAKKRMVQLSFLAIVLTLMLPAVGFIYSIGRGEGQNEFEFLAKNLIGGDIWAIFITVMIIYIIFWWILILLRKRRKV